MSSCRSQQVRQPFLFLRVGKSPRIRRRNPSRNSQRIYAVRDDSNWPIARAYLVEQRKISPPLVDELHGRGSIYANDHRPNPSLVFLHRDQHGKVRGATLRDTRHQSAFPSVPWKQAYRLVRGRRSRRERTASLPSSLRSTP